MDLYGRAWRSVLKGLREGDPGLIIGAGVGAMILWLRRNPRTPRHLTTHVLKPGESVTISLRSPEAEGDSPTDM